MEKKNNQVEQEKKINNLFQISQAHSHRLHLWYSDRCTPHTSLFQRLIKIKKKEEAAKDYVNNENKLNEIHFQLYKYV